MKEVDIRVIAGKSHSYHHANGVMRLNIDVLVYENDPFPLHLTVEEAKNLLELLPAAIEETERLELEMQLRHIHEQVQ